jgi:hypothetical protein
MIPVKITKVELKGIIKNSQEMKDELMKEFRGILKAMRLDVTLRQDVNPTLDEFLTRPLHDIVHEERDKLQEYLLCVNDWRAFLSRQIRLHEAWLTLIAKSQYQSILRQEKAKLVINPKKKYSSEKEKEEELLVYNKDVALAHKKVQVAEANYTLLKGSDETIKDYHFTLQNIIKRTEQEAWLKNQDLINAAMNRNKQQ